MKIIAISDIHGHSENIKKIKDELKKSDLLLIAGDITNFGGWNECKKIIESFEKYNKNIYAVFGNCDSDEVADYLNDRDINLHNNKKYFMEHTFCGLGGSLPCPAKTPKEYTADKIVLLLENIKNKLDSEDNIIFLSHQPPYETKLDVVYSNKHVGCVEIRKFIENIQPISFICGHIHESKGADKIGNTAIFNPGPFFLGNYLYLEIENGRIDRAEIRKV